MGAGLQEDQIMITNLEILTSPLEGKRVGNGGNDAPTSGRSIKS